MHKVEYSIIPYDKRMYCLYVHVNKINEKKYFGITKEYPRNRWGRGSGYYKSTKFYPAIKKYGWDGFYHIVLLTNLSELEATYLEKSFISLYNTTDRAFGYNTDIGGKLSSVSAAAKRKMVKEKRLKPIICLETKVRYESQADLESIDNKSHSYVREACLSKGSRVHEGKHYLYIEDYIKLNLQEIQDIIDGKLQNHQEVVCMETGEVFWDAAKAGRTLLYGKNSISGKCNHFRERGKDNFAGGFHWAFKEDYDKLTPEEIEKVINLDNFKVVCLETGEIYKNPIEAGAQTGANEGSVRRCCEDTLRQANKFHWMYEKDYKKATKEYIEKMFNKPRKKIESTRIKKVICLETKKVYENISDAAKNTRAQGVTISKSCRLGDGFQSGGLHWMFEEDYLKATPEEIEKRMQERKVISNRAKAVICLETRKEFRHAGEVKGISSSVITSCCLFNSGRSNKLRKKCFSAGGFHWLYKEDYDKFSEKKIQEILNMTKETCKVPKKPSNFSSKTKEIINVSTMKEYVSVKDAAIKTGYSKDSIRDACLKEHHTLFGEIWLYKEMYENLTSEEILQLFENMNKYSYKKVVCLETGEIFKGAAEATQKFPSTSASCIISCCTNSDPNRLTAGGVHWMYYKDYLRATPEEVEAKLKTKQGQKASKAVIKLETKEVFSSIEEASSKTGLSSKTIRYSCTGQCITTPKNGHWMFKSDYDKATPKEIEERLKISMKGKMHNMRKVKCIETGEVFKSITEANEAIGGCKNSSMISKCCKNSQLSYKGYHWEHVS